MNKEQAIKIVEQMKDDAEGLCSCVFEKSACNGCREKAITIILQELDKYKNIVEGIQNIYKSMQFSAPENMYLFIDKLGKTLEELKGSDE